jgi:hypothetical protein
LAQRFVKFVKEGRGQLAALKKKSLALDV